MTIISRFSKCHRKHLTQVTDSRERSCLFARNVVTILQGCRIDHLSANMNNETGSNSFAVINQAERPCKTRVIFMGSWEIRVSRSTAESWHRWSFMVNRELRDTLLNTIIEREFNFSVASKVQDRGDVPSRATFHAIPITKSNSSDIQWSATTLREDESRSWLIIHRLIIRIKKFKQWDFFLIMRNLTGFHWNLLSEL